MLPKIVDFPIALYISPVALVSRSGANAVDLFQVELATALISSVCILRVAHS